MKADMHPYQKLAENPEAFEAFVSITFFTGLIAGILLQGAVTLIGDWLASRKPNQKDVHNEM